MRGGTKCGAALGMGAPGPQAPRRHHRLQPHHKSGTGVCVWCWRGQETRDSSHADDDHHSQEPAYKDSKHGWSLSPLTTIDHRSTVASGDQGDGRRRRLREPRADTIQAASTGDSHVSSHQHPQALQLLGLWSRSGYAPLL